MNKKRLNTFQHRFRLERGSVKHKCPGCGHKTFSYYIDVTTGLRVGDEFGSCDRQNNCKYLKTPTVADLPQDASLMVHANEVLPRYLEPEFINIIDSKHLNRSLGWKTNDFTNFLYSLFPKESVNRMIMRYRLGTVENWGKNCVVFWQIDKDFDVRTGKIMGYDPVTGKRVKEPFPQFNWVHTPNKHNNYTDFHLKQCFFGEHLLSCYEFNEVHVVESEKTAVLCSIANPKTFWVATGGLQNISEDRLKPFKDKKLIFYPDKGISHSMWEQKLKPLTMCYNIEISNVVEKMTFLQEGDDIGDYVIYKARKDKEQLESKNVENDGANKE